VVGRSSVALADHMFVTQVRHDTEKSPLDRFIDAARSNRFTGNNKCSLESCMLKVHNSDDIARPVQTVPAHAHVSCEAKALSALVDRKE
jgi:hypothetical protein